MADAVSNQMKEIAAHDISRRLQAAAVGDLNHLRVGIGMGIRCIWIAGINADVMAWNSWHQFARYRDCPFFDVRREPVGVCKNEIRTVSVTGFYAPIGGAGKRGDYHCQR